MSNPVFNQKVLQEERVITSEPMTINGTINKTFISFALLLTSSITVWNLYFQGYMDKVGMLMIAGFIISIVAFLFIMFNKSAMAIATPVYAIAEGLVLGGISSQFERMYPGIAIQAIAMTFMALFSMLFLYRIGAIKCTEKFRSVIFISILGSFFGLHIPQIFSSSLIGIGFSLVVVVIASLNLIIDFDFVERGAQNFLPKSYEWYGAFGLMVTLVWLYLELLNLLAKFRNR